MPYDFDTVVDRTGLGSSKWDVAPGELPMWVADMDFLVAPPIVEAVAARAARGSFGYNETTDDWRSAVAGWWGGRHGWTIDTKEIAFCTGVVPALSSLVRTLTPPGGSVLVQAPVYNHFFGSIRNSGRVVASNDLRYDGRAYSIDWDDLAAKLADPEVTAFILCNPHNPTGQVWTRDELARMGQLAAEHDVIVISDEIHCDIIQPPAAYTPFAVAAPGVPSVVTVSATKAFSIPGLQTSAVVVADETLRRRVFDGLNRDEIGEPNSFALTAATAAFTQGGDWVDEMCAYVADNKRVASAAIEAMGLHVVPGQATYLIWVDGASLVGEDGAVGDFLSFLRAETGLYVSDGAVFGGPRFFRMNLGCPRSLVDDGLARLAAGVAAWRVGH